MTKFKILFGTIMAFALAMMSPCARAQYDWFSGNGTALTTNLSYYVISSKYRPAHVELINAASDSSLSELRFWNASSNSITITNALTAGASNLLVQATNGLAVGDVIVIQGRTNDVYQRCKVHALLGAGSIVITNDLTGTSTNAFDVFAGDYIWRMTQTGKIPWFQPAITTNGWLGTNTFSPPNGIFHTLEGRPGLVEFGLSSGGSTNTVLNLISGTYGVPRPR